ncbi:hypothetical protein EJ06DRAFT_585551 [Trichodelitschia bisporula]|uniref:Uncharacterized protein n=1 Tax=Trichodelitschia bisporula TaxID=703511 RepID=A0A6G1HIX7_9PEZI|nr:hypothetical protein EJ06DRAFT_585551 [Trichodelitschia bisporula]
MPFLKKIQQAVSKLRAGLPSKEFIWPYETDTEWLIVDHENLKLQGLRRWEILRSFKRCVLMVDDDPDVHLAYSVLTPPAPGEKLVDLAVEDFFIFVPNPDGEYRLQAAIELFPFGWEVNDNFGSTAAELDYTEFLRGISKGPVLNCYMTGFQADISAQHLRTKYFVRDSEYFFPDGLHQLTAENLVARRLTINFRKLPVSGALVTVAHTRLKHLTDHTDQELRQLVKELNSMPVELLSHTSRALWDGLVREYRRSRQSYRST